MAQLSSPGVSVSVIDESFYTPSAPGTVPLIIVASGEGKQNGSGTGIAPGTLKTNAGKVYLLTGQKDLSDTFGTPKFFTDASNNPIHAGERNEYGLQAAYSFLGVSNRAYVVRADVDMGQLNPTTSAPTGNPNDGQFWFDTANTKFGIFEWNGASAAVYGGQTFTVKYPTIIIDPTKVSSYPSDNTPKLSIGSIGSYALVAVSTINTLWYKKPETNTPAGWVEVGTDEWTASRPTIAGTAYTTLSTGDTITINTKLFTVASLSELINSINTDVDLMADGITAASPMGKIELYSTGKDIVIASGGTALTKLGLKAGTYTALKLSITPHYQVPQYKSSAEKRPTGSMWIKTTSPNMGADWIVKKYNANTKQWSEINAPLYANNASALRGIDSTGGGINIPTNALYVKYNDSEDIDTLANFKIYRRKEVGSTTIISDSITANKFSAMTYEFTMSTTIIGSSEFHAPVSVSFTATGNAFADADAILTAINNQFIGSNVVATLIPVSNQIKISQENGGDIKFIDGTNKPLSILFNASTTPNFYVDPSNVVDHYVSSLWTSVTDNKLQGFAPASNSEPTTVAADQVMWYDNNISDVDIMVHNGQDWVGYLDASAKLLNHAGISDAEDTDPNGPIISATKPLTQSDGSALANNDLWISTADLENYPLLYKYDLNMMKWVLVDNTDQTTENGILFHDARWSATGKISSQSTIPELLISNFLDFDAPDPALYPKGMLLWNLRRSGFNVKRFHRNYVNPLLRNPRQSDELMTDYYPHMWVSEAANQETGMGSFGRKAQRRVVLQALNSLINKNQQIRDEESKIFNLIACPGYPETMKSLVGLNTDRGLTSFIVGDTPSRLTPDATTLSNWGNNVNNATEDGDDGLVTTDPYLGIYYPWGYTTDLVGNHIVVPPSHMMLRTIALSDNVSYPWFAPAGTRRGGITNASSVGYIESTTGEFQSIALNNGQRDTLASIHTNPITYITGTGIVAYGQYTRQLTASALDRINVARLIVYLRSRLALLAKPYMWEPNDKITRDEIKQAAESMLLELVGQRAIYDYVVVCDTSNNTPSRIDRNELWLDIAIEPVKAIEFIYIPLRLKNTGEISSLGI